MKRRAIPAISLALVVLFSASFLLALPGAVSMPASAVTQAEIDALKESAGELEQQQKEIQAQLNAIAADKDEALEQKSLLEQQINVIQSEINNIDAQIAKYDELISQKEDELAQLEQQGKLSAVVTQNIDGLHQAAGSQCVYELHGSVHRNYCQRCGAFYDAR